MTHDLMDRYLTYRYRLPHIISLSYLYLLLSHLHYTDARLGKNDIVNPHPFGYHLNNEALCTSHHTDVLLWIHTAPVNFRNRMLLRDSWGNPKNYRKHNATLVFFLGMSEDEKIQKNIEYESEQYRDIVQETFLDSYRNLTYKAISGCKWTSTYCKSADLILKADDDMVVDIYLLFRHIDSLREKGKVLKNTILCDVWYKRAPERASGKWKVSKLEYAGDYYPPYCPGLGLIMTSDIVPKLYEESLYEPYFWVDDVYFTGILGKTINVTFEQLAATVHFGPSVMLRRQAMFSNMYQWMFYHVRDKRVFSMLWGMASERESARLEQGILSST